MFRLRTSPVMWVVAIVFSLSAVEPAAADFWQTAARGLQFAGWTPLLCAAQGGHARIVEQLLQAGADVNTSDQLGRTPMVLAVANKHKETAALLRKAGGK